MSGRPFGSEAVRLGEALYRSAGHCFAASELYSGGRPSDALLQAARPMTDVLPWLEMEARSNSPQLASFMNALARVGAEVRATAPPRSVRKAVAAVSEAVDELLAGAVGSVARSESYYVAVALALLCSARDSFARSVIDENIGDYHSAYAAAREAFRLLARVDESHFAGMGKDMTLLWAAFPGADPPEQLVRPETIGRALENVTRTLSNSFDVPGPRHDLDESLAKIERLLDETVVAHAHGVPALAARLAASLYVRSYDPIRDEIAARDAAVEERLSELLGVRVRKAINDGVTVEELDGLRREAKHLIRATKSLDLPERGG